MTTITGGGGFGMDPAQMLEKMQARFNASDTDNSGGVSQQEFLENAPKGQSASQIDALFARLDADESGDISDEEHQALMEEMSQRMPSMEGSDNHFSMNMSQRMEKMQQLLANSDTDENGSVSLKEFIAGAPEDSDATRAEELFNQLDANEDGEVTLAEQQAMMSDKAAGGKPPPPPLSSDDEDSESSVSTTTDFQSLIDSLSSDSNEDQQSSILEMLAAQNQQDKTDKMDLAKSMLAFSKQFPRIDTVA